MHMGALLACMSVHREARRRYQISWNWTYTQSNNVGGCWELSLGPLEEQAVLVTM